MSKIIIDGCNVAECRYYFYEDTEKAHTCRLIQVDDDLHYICKDNPNCYFKQLQRAKAENERIVKILDCKNGTIATLEAENEKLKAELDKYKRIVSFNIKDYLKDNHELKKIHDKEVLHFLLSIFALPEWQEDLNKTLNEVLNDE